MMEVNRSHVCHVWCLIYLAQCYFSDQMNKTYMNSHKLLLRTFLFLSFLKLKVDTTSVGDELKLYKKKFEQLQENLFNTQVENTTLHSQSTSLLSQINQLQNTQTVLEASKKKYEEDEKLRKAEKEELLRDQVKFCLFVCLFRWTAR